MCPLLTIYMMKVKCRRKRKKNKEKDASPSILSRDLELSLNSAQTLANHLKDGSGTM